MVKTQVKTVNQAPAERPPLRTPPKRTFSETQGALPKQLGTEQPKEIKDTLRATQRRRSTPVQTRLDAKTMMKLVPTLSERELKQLVNTIVRRRKREEAAQNSRPSEPTAARGTTTVAPESAPRTSNTATTIVPPMEQHPFEVPAPKPRGATLGPGVPQNTFENLEMKIRSDAHTAEESILAGALLRQANRRSLSS